MTTRKKMTREEEREFYARHENQTPQGPARRRAPRLTEMVPVRFPPEVLDEGAQRATTLRCVVGRLFGVPDDLIEVQGRAPGTSKRAATPQHVGILLV